MRTPKYLSPTSIDKYESDPEEFYLQYIADERPPRFPQTQPMSVGSAFDAFIKNYYHDCLFGKGHDPEFAAEKIFEDQVEEHNRDWAWWAGLHAFKSYKDSGACADLLLELQRASDTPRFEFTLEKELFGVPLLGKPDVYFLNKEGQPIVLDWKVNGYCAKANKSPARGYVMVRDGWLQGKPSRGANSTHKDAFVMKQNGISINVSFGMELVDKKWAAQLATYAWLMGARVGEQFICAIDQLCCKQDGSAPFPCRGKESETVDVRLPLIRVAEHRCCISEEYQKGIQDRYINLWGIIHDGENWFFRDLPKEESQRRQSMLDQVHKAFLPNENNGEGTDELFQELMGR